MSGNGPRIRILSADEWSAAWNGYAPRTYFQGPGWNQAWEDAFPGSYRAVCLSIRFEGGPELVLPGCERIRARGTERGFWSVPGDGSAGFLNPAEEWAPRLSAVRDALRKTYHSVRLVQPDPTGTDDHAHQVDLTDGRAETLFRKSRGGQYARQAAAKGLIVTDGDADRLIADLLPVYDRLRAHWASKGLRHTVVPEALVRSVARRPGVAVAGVRDSDGRLLLGGFLLEAGSHVASWFTFADPDSRKLRAQELYFFTLLERYRDRGFRTFDFNQSAGLAGVAQFKEKFGAEPHPLRILTARSAWSRGIDLVDRWRMR